jgi:antitoxin component of MazEF toxin-antitoxin module
MPLIKKLSRVGNSMAVLLDKSLLAQADLAPDADVEISVQDKSIVIRQHRYLSTSETRAIGERIAAKRRKLLERLAK